MLLLNKFHGAESTTRNVNDMKVLLYEGYFDVFCSLTIETLLSVMYDKQNRTNLVQYDSLSSLGDKD